MIVAQPTWGVDVGAAQLIRQALIDLRNQGVAVLVVSEELDELFMICDRIAVLADGRLSPVVAAADTSVAQIGLWMSGEFTRITRSWLMLRLERRAQPSTVMMFASPLIAAVCMLVTGYLLFSLLGKAPLHAFCIFFIQPLTTTYGIGEVAIESHPADSVRPGAVHRFSCQRMEHRCGRPAHHGRNCCWRRSAVFPSA